MASPISIGDIISVCTVAYKVYERCRSSVTEFRELSREVSNLQMILDEIQSFWQKAEDRLSEEKKIRLGHICAGCREVLDDLDALLTKHRELGKGQSWRERLKWAPRDIGPMRNRLLATTMYLNTFNTALVASSAADAQEKSKAQILLAVNTIHKDYEDGKRRKPALSQATADDIDQDESEAWAGITSEIVEQNVDKAVISANRNFIKRWIFRVMLEDVGESEEYDVDKEPASTPAQERPRSHGAETEDMYGGNGTGPERVTSWVSDQSQDQMEYDVLPTGSSELDEQAPIERIPSFGSHRSKSSDWRPVAGPNPEYAEALLVKLLQSGETSDKNREHVTLIAKRIFRQLDFTDRGHLFHGSVEQRCWSAIQKTDIRIDKARLSQLIRAGDKDHNNKIDVQEFITFVGDLLSTAHDAQDRTFREDIEASGEKGCRYLSQYIAFHLNAPLCWNWSLSGNIWEFKSPTRILFQSRERPRSDLNAFANMELAANHCIDILDATFEEWSRELTNLSKQRFDEYQIPFKIVLEVAAQFSVFGLKHPEGSWELDFFDEIAALIPMEQDAMHQDCPVMALRLLKDQCFTLLRSIAGFVMAMNSLSGCPNEKDPLSIEDWRCLRINDRAERILQSSSIFQGARSIIDQSRQWFHDHPEMSKAAIEGIELAFKLHEQQLELEKLRQLASDVEALRLQNEATIEIVGATNLPKKNRINTIILCHLRSMVTENNEFLLDTSIVKGCDPVWNSSYTCILGLEDRLQFSLYVGYDGIGGQASTLSAQKEITVADVLSNSGLHSAERKNYDLALGDTTKGSYRDSWVEIAITPKAGLQKEQEWEREEFADIKQLLKGISQLPLPWDWTMEHTIDGRVFFSRGRPPIKSSSLYRSQTSGTLSVATAGSRRRNPTVGNTAAAYVE